MAGRRTEFGTKNGLADGIGPSLFVLSQAMVSHVPFPARLLKSGNVRSHILP
ncbi:MAG: hypothetical protein WBO17_01770 [Sphingorhabdus sp.]